MLFRVRCAPEKIERETFSDECISSTRGEHYIGHINRTISGIACQHWSEQWPHAHSYDDIEYFADYSSNPDVELHDVVNYCRNPVRSAYFDGQPWCFTIDEDVEKEFCDVPRCKRKTRFLLLS